MGPTGTRILAYGFASVLTGALVYFGFIYRGDPDPTTLLSSVDVQLRLAGVMPEKDKEGRILESRARMLRDVEINLDLLAARLPDYAPAQEYRAYLSYLKGDLRGAADHYRDLRGMADCSPDLWDSAVFNEVGIAQELGDLDRALRVITQSRPRLQDRNGSRANLTRASLLSKLDRREEAVRTAAEVGRRAAEDPVAALEAGRLLESWQRVAEAEAAYLAASGADPRGIYYRARLKVRAGNVDEGVRLLELAVSAAASEVCKLVARDRQDWEVAVGTERLSELIGSEEPVSAPGR